MGFSLAEDNAGPRDGENGGSEAHRKKQRGPKASLHEVKIECCLVASHQQSLPSIKSSITHPCDDTLQ